MLKASIVDSPVRWFGSERALDRLIVLMVFTVVSAPVMFLNTQFTDNYDEAKYHLPAIVRFAAQLPNPDLRHYSSATTPLYHLLFAVLLRFGFSLTGLRLINFAISAATVMMVVVYLQHASAPNSRNLATAAAMLFATSIYVVGPSVRLTTDNLALGCSIGVLYLLDSQTERDRFGWAVLLTVVAVLTRQLYLWMIPILFGYALTNKKWETRRKLQGIGLSVLPLLSLAPLFMLWHGLANPDFVAKHELHNGLLNGKALALALSMLGAFAVVFAPSLIRVLSPALHVRYLVPSTIALALVLLPMLGAQAGSYQVPMEGGWLRSMAEHSPVLFGNWVLFWLLFPAGCLVVVAMIYHVATTRREIWIVLAFGLWLIVNIMQSRAMAKYYEPFEIIVVGRFAVRARAGFRETVPAWLMVTMFVVFDISRFWLGSEWASPGFSHH